MRVLASSRQALGIEGEMTYRMPSLPVPLPGDGTALTAADALAFAGIALFTARASAADSRFVLSDENAPIVAEICTRLDGIALAIELAASRVKMLSPKQLRGRLDERFRVLTGGKRDVLPRQQTLRALIDWSHDLLDERERALFRRVGIFVSGFTFEGAVVVGTLAELGEDDVFDVLASLVEKSLVLVERNDDAMRYRLLESTRAYALEKLVAAGERDAIEGRHLEYLRDRFVGLKADVEQTCVSLELLEPFEAELDDGRSALDGALRRPDLRAGAELLVAVERSWEMSRLSREGIARIESFVEALPADEGELLARLQGTAAALFISLGNAERAAEMATRALDRARAGCDRSTLAFTLHCNARAQAFVGNLAAAQAAVSEAQSIPERSTRIGLFLLDMRAMLDALAGDYEAAVGARLALRDEWRKRGNVHNEYVQSFHLALVEHSRDRTSPAIAIISEILPALRRSREKALLGEALLLLASLLVVTDQLTPAIVATREAIDLFAGRSPEHFLVSLGIQDLALIFALQEDIERAAVLAGYAGLALERSGTKRDALGVQIVTRLTALLQQRLAPEALAQLVARGAALTPATAVAYALETVAALT